MRDGLSSREDQDSDEEGNKYNEFNFFRAPVGPAPTLQQVAPAAPAAFSRTPTSAAAAPSPQVDAGRAPMVDPKPKPILVQPPPRPGFEHLMPKPVPVEEMSTEDIKAMLTEFEKRWRSKYGRGISMADANQLPVQILALYDQMGRRLTPEQRA